MEHHFNISIAKEYGIEEAILLHNIFFWLSKNASNNRHFYDGLYWFYNSKKAFVELFPYMNETKIFRVVKKLEENGLLVKGNHNQDKWVKTNWYALTKNGIMYMLSHGYENDDLSCILQNDTIDSVKMNDGACQSERCNIIKYTDTNTYSEDNKKENYKKEKVNDDFIDKVYSLYPTKCPIRNCYLGKSKKDKDRIRRLLKDYSKEEIINVIQKEIDTKYGKFRMQNFSTFLNNFPDPSVMLFDEDKTNGAYPKGYWQ